MKKLTIGKAPNNDIVISNDPTVSRKHAHLLIDGDTSITDLNSTNGTYVNGGKINGTQLLEPLDVVRLGNSLLDWAFYNEKTVIDIRVDKCYPLPDPPDPIVQNPPASNSGWQGITSLSCAVLGIFIFGLPLGICAVIFGALGLDKKFKGLAIAGIILGIIEIIIMIQFFA